MPPFATAWFYRIDEVITVQGRLVPQQGGVEVKSPVRGQLDQVLVKSGEQVKEGQVLLRFDVEAAKAEESTLSRQLSLEEKRVEDQLKGNIQRQKTLERNIDLTKRILDKLKPLEKSGAISELQILQQSNQLETQRDELIQLKNKREELTNDSRSRQAQLQGSLDLVRDKLRNELVKAPISGTVFDLHPIIIATSQ